MIKDKFKKITELCPDLAVIPELPDPSMFQNEVTIENSIWYGQEKGIGLGIISFSKDYKLSMLVDEIKYEWVVPIQVSGQEDFILLAVWTKRTPGYSSYGHILYSALKEYEHFLKNKRVIIIGDFNIDKNLPSSYSGIQGRLGFERIIELLHSCGLTSCYHYFSNEEFGSESKATYYHYRKSTLPFHIDYCFASQEMIQRTKQFYVDNDEDWAKLSDHLPLVFEL